jgi:hypothetical protein
MTIHSPRQIKSMHGLSVSCKGKQKSTHTFEVTLCLLTLFGHGCSGLKSVMKKAALITIRGAGARRFVPSVLRACMPNRILSAMRTVSRS